MAVWKSYRRDADYSYTLGAFPTFELMQRRPEQVLALLMHPSFSETEAAERVENFAASHRLPLHLEAKAIDRLSPRDNCFLIGIFAKYRDEPRRDASNLVLVRPSNAGNLGTIIRAMLGFALSDLVILRPGADLFDPKVVRASMGALFALHHIYYDTLEEYLHAFPKHQRYPFMLDGQYPLRQVPSPPKGYPFSLIFGNEAAGLDEAYREVGQSVVIPHEAAIDSLNLTLAVGIALHEFYERQIGK